MLNLKSLWCQIIHLKINLSICFYFLFFKYLYFCWSQMKHTTQCVNNIWKWEVSHGCTVWMSKYFMLCIVIRFWKNNVLRTLHSSLHETYNCIVIYFVTQQTLWHQVWINNRLWNVAGLKKCGCPRLEPWGTPQI